MVVHISFTLKLNANFCALKKEGHFHYKNFLRALKHKIKAQNPCSLIGYYVLRANQREVFCAYRVGMSYVYSF